MSGQLAPEKERPGTPSTASYAGDEAVDELLHRTCTARGLPIVIEDPAAIAKIAAIVAERGDR